MSKQYSIPREIIKWIYSLDLSTPIKDIKRDFLNGFQIAEIINKYHPNKIFLHSFTNSYQKAEKQSNWHMLEKTFNKINFQIDSNEYITIQDGNQEKLIFFLSKLYTFLTNKKVEINEKPLANFEKKDKTKTFLLTDTGLEQIDITQKKIEITQNLTIQNQENEKMMQSISQESLVHQNSKESLKNSLVFSKSDLNQILNENQNQVKFQSNKNINLGRIKENNSAKKSNFKTKQISITNGNKYIEDETQYKSVQEQINQFLLEVEEVTEKEVQMITNSPRFYYDFSVNVNSFSDNFFISFLRKLNGEINFMTKMIIKDFTEFYKFLVFILNLVINFNEERKGFVELVLFVRKSFRLLAAQDQLKCVILIQNYFLEFIYQNFCKLKNQKKYYFIKILSFLFMNNNQTDSEFLNIFQIEKNFSKYMINIISTLSENQEELNPNNQKLYTRKYYLIRKINKQNNNEQKMALVKTLINFCRTDFQFIEMNFEKFNFLFDEKEQNQNLKILLIIFLSKVLKYFIQKIKQQKGNRPNSLSKSNNQNQSQQQLKETKHMKLKKNTQQSIIFSPKNEKEIENNLQQIFIKNLVNLLQKLFHIKEKIVKLIFLVSFEQLMDFNEDILKIYLDNLLSFEESFIEEMLQIKCPIVFKEENLSQELLMVDEMENLKREDNFFFIQIQQILNETKQKEKNQESILELAENKSKNSLQDSNDNSFIEEKEFQQNQNYLSIKNQIQNLLKNYFQFDLEFSLKKLEENSAQILLYFFQNSKQEKKENFWHLAQFCFSNCNFKQMNYEQFDTIVNQMMILLVEEIKKNQFSPIFAILNQIIELEIKKEIEILNFEKNLKSIFQEPFFTKEKIKMIFEDLLEKYKQNEVYQSYLKELQEQSIELKIN